MRISDWSSDVCSSDLLADRAARDRPRRPQRRDRPAIPGGCESPAEADERRRRVDQPGRLLENEIAASFELLDRKRVVWVQSVSVRVDLGGRRIINKNNKNSTKANTSISRQNKK